MAQCCRAYELFRNEQSLSDTFRPRLLGIAEFESPLRACPQQRLKIGKIARRGDQQDLADAAHHEERRADNR